MPIPHPFRFGVVNFAVQSRAALVELARRVEGLGFSILLSPDHFGEVLAPLPALMAAADATQHLRVGTYVCANDFRHPVLLAREAATLDLLSEGRFELGIGAGYLPADYTASGIRRDPFPVRIARLEEAVRVIKALWSDGPVTVSGDFYSVSELEGYPRPLQRPHPPLFIGGGSRRLLSLAAREADIVGLIPPWPTLTKVSLADAAERVDLVRREAGERFDSLELNTLVYELMVTDRRRDAAEEVGARWGITAEQVLDSPHFLVGTVDQLTEDIRKWRRETGISYVSVFAPSLDAFAPVVARLAGA